MLKLQELTEPPPISFLFYNIDNCLYNDSNFRKKCKIIHIPHIVFNSFLPAYGIAAIYLCQTGDAGRTSCLRACRSL